MAKSISVYDCLWRPEEHGYNTTEQIIPLLENGKLLLEAHPNRAKEYCLLNGWGTYETFCKFLNNVLAHCIKHPHYLIEANR